MSRRVVSVGSSREKMAEWTGRLRRFEQSNQTVARFCQDEGVSQPSFYSWKKKLRDLTPAAGGSQFQPVHLDLTSASASASASVLTGRQETIVRLGRDIEIELGSDLSVVGKIVESIVQHLLAASDQNAHTTRSTEAESC